MNAMSMLLYWTDWVGRQEPDAGNFYSFNDVRGDTAFDSALVEYHKANFAGAVRGFSR